MKIRLSLIAFIVLLAGCASKGEKAIWVAVDKPFEGFEVVCMSQRPCSCEPIKSGSLNVVPFCSFSIEGFWRSTSGPGSEIASPDAISILCRQDADEGKKCVMQESSVSSTGKLAGGSTEYPISLWTNDQIIATSVGGICEIGDQIVVDIKNSTVMRRRYPTKNHAGDDFIHCGGALNNTDTYVLHGGFWQLTPPAGKTFQAAHP